MTQLELFPEMSPLTPSKGNRSVRARPRVPMVEGECDTASSRIAPAGTLIETRMAARMVEEILRRHFKVPESMNDQARAMSKEVASTMNQHFLATHKLYWRETQGSA